MNYKEASEKIPNVAFLYENVTMDEISQIQGSKYGIEDGVNTGLYIVGTHEEIDFLEDKKMTPSYGMNFG